MESPLKLTPSVRLNQGEGKEVAYQKLDYTHYNPCTEYWKLAKEPCNYFFSSAKYYEKGVKDFLFLKDLRNEF